MTDYRALIRDDLWSNNAIFAQLLALCPALAVTSTATNGLGMGLTTTAVLTATNLIVSLLSFLVVPSVRIPVFIGIIASMVTVVEMLTNAFANELYLVLGVFIPLITVNCMVFGRAEAFASKNKPFASMIDGFLVGLGFTWAMVLIGAVREILGSGTLFANADLLLGSSFAFLEVTLIPDYKGFLIMILPPGGFLVIGFLLVLKRWIDRRMEEAAEARKHKAAPELIATDSSH